MLFSGLKRVERAPQDSRAPKSSRPTSPLWMKKQRPNKSSESTRRLRGGLRLDPWPWCPHCFLQETAWFPSLLFPGPLAAFPANTLDTTPNHNSSISPKLAQFHVAPISVTPVLLHKARFCPPGWGTRLGNVEKYYRLSQLRRPSSEQRAGELLAILSGTGHPTRESFRPKCPRR